MGLEGIWVDGYQAPRGALGLGLLFLSPCVPGVFSSWILCELLCVTCLRCIPRETVGVVFERGQSQGSLLFAAVFRSVWPRVPLDRSVRLSGLLDVVGQSLHLGRSHIR